MKTFSGKNAPLPNNDEAPDTIDLVVHLGRTKRFGGWGNDKWTVLHHTMLGSLLWLRQYGAAGMHHFLLHDAHEYITGDIPSPVKAFMGVDAVKALEGELDERIRSMLSATAPVPSDAQRVKLVDQAALIIEAFYFGTPGSFNLIGEENWGYNIGVTAEARAEIRKIIGNLCPDVLAAMGWLKPSPGSTGTYAPVYA